MLINAIFAASNLWRRLLHLLRVLQRRYVFLCVSCDITISNCYQQEFNQALQNLKLEIKEMITSSNQGITTHYSCIIAV